MCFAIPGEIRDVWTRDGAPFATVDFAGEQRQICLAFLPGLAVGDWVIAHAGYALSKLEPEQVDQVMDSMQLAAAALGMEDVDPDDRAAAALAAPEPVIAPAAAQPPSHTASESVASQADSDAVDYPLHGVEQPDGSAETCLTCSDNAVACQVVRLPDQLWGTTLVRTPLGEEEVDASLVGDLVVGDRILVHAKTAIWKLSVHTEGVPT
jgi:hydrogenase expression/formation protein HypC